MKLIKLEDRLRFRRISRYRMKARKRSKLKNINSIKAIFISPANVIKAPKSFDLIRGSGSEVVKFLRAVSIAVLNKKLQVKLNFKDTENFYVPATILLYAELDRIITLSILPKPISIRDPFRRRPREVLKQIGIHTLTNDNSDVVPSRDDVVYWRATKGSTQSGDSYGSLLEAIAERANRDHAQQLELSGVWRSVNEAIANSIDHAYMKPRFDSFNGLDDTKWWMFSQIKDAVFTLAVCDLGCGYRQTINETMPEKFIAAFASTLNWKNRDAVAIETAMEYGRSGTRQDNRGKGSRDVLSLLQKHGNGELVVLSNTGWIRYVYSNHKEVEKLNGALEIDIGGTIVWWKLPLTELNYAEN
ncbi:MAG: hypothetical protein Q8Q76_09425 [Methylotenera sp.]|nr:hypothetical protein [Methylotenera sp.]